jgi:hypothetical protein
MNDERKEGKKGKEMVKDYIVFYGGRLLKEEGEDGKVVWNCYFYTLHLYPPFSIHRKFFGPYISLP